MEEIFKFLVTTLLILLIKLLSNLLKTIKPFNSTGVNVHILKIRCANNLLLFELCDFLLIHFHFLLEFLDANFHAVNKDLSVDDCRKS